MSNDNRTLRRLGRTDLYVSPLAMGCWAIAGDSLWGEQDEKDAIDSLRAAVDAGINFFDTAEAYGSGYSEELCGKALHDLRDQVVIGTKVGPKNAGSWHAVRQACEDSLRRLQTDVIDVYHLHWPNRTIPITETLDLFQRLQDEGKIRSFAVSNFGKGDLTDLLEHGRCEANQLPYSLLWRVVEREIVPICCQHDISVTCYSPLAQALLTGKFRTVDDVPDGRTRTRHFASTRPLARHSEDGCEDETFAALQRVAEIASGTGQPMADVALAWLMQQPGVGSVLVGMRNPQQVAANARSMDLVLAEKTVQQLNAATDELRNLFGLNPDMWQSDSRYR